MSLVYLITSLPRVLRDRPLAITREELVRRARGALAGEERRQLELLLLCEEVDETSRILAEAEAEEPPVDAASLVARLKSDRRRPPLAPPVDELPEWVLQPTERHVTLRRYYQHLYEEGGAFLLAWARFATDLGEVLTGLVAQREPLGRDRFLHQMEGHFDSSSEVIVGRYDRPDLGLGRRFPWMPRVLHALDAGDPVTTERQLDDLRWEIIEDAMGTEVFSLEQVLGTYLKVQILERQASWTSGAGRERLDTLLAPPGALASPAGASGPGATQGAPP